MKNLTKYILSFIIISLLTFSLLTKTSQVLAIPAVPNVPTVPTIPETPDKPHPPTVPPVPTTPGTCCGQPTATPQPQNPSPTSVLGQNPTPPVGGINVTPGPSEGGESAPTSSVSSQVLGLSKASQDMTLELGLMIAGLIIASFGIRHVLAKN